MVNQGFLKFYKKKKDFQGVEIDSKANFLFTFFFNSMEFPPLALIVTYFLLYFSYRQIVGHRYGKQCQTIHSRQFIVGIVPKTVQIKSAPSAYVVSTKRAWETIRKQTGPVMNAETVGISSKFYQRILFELQIVAFFEYSLRASLIKTIITVYI